MDSGLGRTKRLHHADGRARLVLVFVPALLAILLAAGPLAARASAYSLLTSSSADRSASAPLQGNTVSGNIYVFVSPSTGVTQVRFYLDDTARTGSPIKTENGAPWDFAGTASDTAKSANPYDSKLLANGQHTITAAIDKSAGGTDVVSSSFTVSNGGGCSPCPDSLLVSSSVSRSNPTPLAGRAVSGDIFVFVPANSGIIGVRFYLDNPQRVGTPTRTEGLAPWDFAGTASDGTANPYSTLQLSDGSHSITAAITRSTGVNVVSVVSASFTTALTPTSPTQWVAKIFTEAEGRSPPQESWNSWMAYYGDRDCNAQTLATLGRATYTSSDFLALGYDNAAKLLALYRGALNREPTRSDVTSLLPSLDDGSLTWTTLVDSTFGSAEFATLATAICDPNDPNYSFTGAPPGDLRQWAYGSRSRTQEELQQALDDAQATCGTVELARMETVFVGGDQPGTAPENGPLRIPSCVTLTTAGDPGPHQYASMGRLVLNGRVCDSLRCDHLELVRLGDGARLANVWVDGRGSDPGDQRIALVGARSGGTATEIIDNRVSDPPADGTAVRADGYDTSGDPCSNRVVSGNLITGYATRQARSRLGKALSVDGISVFCEQATVQNNELVDISDMGIVVHGSWNSATAEQRTQRSTVSGNRVISAGISARVALGADAVGECLAEGDGPPVDCIEFSHDRDGSSAERSFVGTSFAGNTFWTGSRTQFDIGLMVGSKMIWGDNGPLARGASFTNDTTGDVSTSRVNTGIAISGMFDTDLRGNTAIVDATDTNPAVTDGKCPEGDVLYESGLAGFALGSQPATEVSGLYGCLADHPPAQGMERIELGPERTFVGKDSGERFNPWGQNEGGVHHGFDHKLDVFDLREAKQMGSNVLRIHLQFKDIMESCTSANPTALDELGDTLRRAEENGIYLDLTGLSSYAGSDEDPACYRDATEQERWAAQEAFWGAVAERTANSPAVFALDIMNEPEIPGGETPCWGGPPPADQPNAPYCRKSFFGYYFHSNITRTPGGRSAAQIGRAWVTRMRDAIRAHDSEHLITLGCLPLPKCVGLSATELASLIDYLSVHIYPRDCTGPPPPLPNPDPCGAQRSPERSTGDPLAGERQLLATYAKGGDPVVVEETFPIFRNPELERDFILDSRPYATGWLGQWGPSTMSQDRATPAKSPWLYYLWGRVFQRLTSTVTATMRSTDTSVSCSPSSLTVSASATCTATVSENGSEGKAPTGTVSFVTRGAGNFSSAATCGLSPTATAGQASCSLTFTPTATGTYAITGGYGGNITNEASSGPTMVTATRTTP